jgi:CRISPR-associated endoribonuclease Cas6
MYFAALVLTLRASPASMALTHEERQCLCETIVGLLKQRVHATVPCLVKTALLSRGASHTTIRITFAEHSSPYETPASLQTLLTLPSLHVKQRDHEVESIDLTDTTWSAIATWDDLMQRSMNSILRFSLATPLILGSPQESRAKSKDPFPEPWQLFSRLKRRWDQLEGPRLSQDIEQLLEASGCTVSNYRLDTVHIQGVPSDYRGYRGWIEYTCRTRHSPAISALNALARLAFFTGLGEYTEQGMGETTVALLS